MLRRVFFASLLASVLASAQEAVPAAAPSAATQPSPVPDDATRVAVLGYHDFSEAQPETEMRMHTSKFRKQMETLRQLGITAISLEDFLAWKRGEKSLPEKCALITLDDGWKSVYTDAYPILKEFGYPFTLYLYKNYVDVGGKSLKGPSDKMMAELRYEVSAAGVAALYRDICGTFMIDEADEMAGGAIEALGVKPVVRPTVMKSVDDKERLARHVLALFRR